MEKNQKYENDISKEKTRSLPYDPEQPHVLPNIRRYQFFTNLKDRMLTKDLNRLAMLGIAAGLGGVVLKPAVSGTGASIYCLEDRKCYATQERCAAGIAYQAELTIASRVGDYIRFINNNGMLCVGCGNCVEVCVLHLNLPQIYEKMQQLTVEAILNGKVPVKIVEQGLQQGRFGRPFIDRVANWLMQRGRGYWQETSG